MKHSDLFVEEMDWATFVKDEDGNTIREFEESDDYTISETALAWARENLSEGEDLYLAEDESGEYEKVSGVGVDGGLAFTSDPISTDMKFLISPDGELYSWHASVHGEADGEQDHHGQAYLAIAHPGEVLVEGSDLHYDWWEYGGVEYERALDRDGWVVGDSTEDYLHIMKMGGGSFTPSQRDAIVSVMSSDVYSGFGSTGETIVIECPGFGAEFGDIGDAISVFRDGADASPFRYSSKIAEARSNEDGCMIALVPPEEVAEALAVDGGEAPENMHVTLAYLGDAEEYDLQELAGLVEKWTREADLPQPHGGISGYGCFSNDKYVLYATPDIPHLDDLRVSLSAVLEDHYGIDLDEKHGFSPHLTLDYADEPYRELPDLPDLGEFEWRIVLAHGGDWYDAAPLEKTADARSGMGGAIVALVPDENLKSQVVIPGGLPPEDLHISLAPIGPSSAVDQDLMWSTVAAWAQTQPKLSGRVTGYGQFETSKGYVLWGAVDVPGIQEMRESLLQALASVGITLNTQFEFEPHMTLDWSDEPYDTTGQIETDVSEFDIVVTHSNQRQVVGSLEGGIRWRRGKSQDGDTIYTSSDGRFEIERDRQTLSERKRPMWILKTPGRNYLGNDVLSVEENFVDAKRMAERLFQGQGEFREDPGHPGHLVDETIKHAVELTPPAEDIFIIDDAGTVLWNDNGETAHEQIAENRTEGEFHKYLRGWFEGNVFHLYPFGEEFNAASPQQIQAVGELLSSPVDMISCEFFSGGETRQFNRLEPDEEDVEYFLDWLSAPYEKFAVVALEEISSTPPQDVEYAVGIFWTQTDSYYWNYRDPGRMHGDAAVTLQGGNEELDSAYAADVYRETLLKEETDIVYGNYWTAYREVDINSYVGDPEDWMIQRAFDDFPEAEIYKHYNAETGEKSMLELRLRPHEYEFMNSNGYSPDTPIHFQQSGKFSAEVGPRGVRWDSREEAADWGLFEPEVGERVRLTSEDYVGYGLWPGDEGTVTNSAFAAGGYVALVGFEGEDGGEEELMLSPNEFETIGFDDLERQFLLSKVAMTPEEQAEYERILSEGYDETTLYRAVLDAGGLKTRDDLRTEYREIPNTYKRRDGLTGDEMADHLAMYYPQFGITDERSLIDGLRKTAESLETDGMRTVYRNVRLHSDSDTPTLEDFSKFSLSSVGVYWTDDYMVALHWSAGGEFYGDYGEEDWFEEGGFVFDAILHAEVPNSSVRADWREIPYRWDFVDLFNAGVSGADEIKAEFYMDEATHPDDLPDEWVERCIVEHYGLPVEVLQTVQYEFGEGEAEVTLERGAEVHLSHIEVFHDGRKKLYDIPVNRTATASLSKTSESPQVEDKAQKIHSQGGVKLVSCVPDPESGQTTWEFTVKSTSGNTYALYGDSKYSNPGEWIDWSDVACNCEWGRWNYDRAPEYKHLEANYCAHALAASHWLAENGQNEQQRNEKALQEKEPERQRSYGPQAPGSAPAPSAPAPAAAPPPGRAPAPGPPQQQGMPSPTPNQREPFRDFTEDGETPETPSPAPPKSGPEEPPSAQPPEEQPEEPVEEAPEDEETDEQEYVVEYDEEPLKSRT